ncbi:MAG: phosphate ABC transporter permease family protein, partial [Pseudomonadota bacterium]|nr:phosphate ABC transporter permease family protein [Pseudomonadota bacterium]
MSVGSIVLVVLVLAALGYFFGRRRAVAASAKSGVKLHSLSGYYGQTVALFTAVPALLLMVAWLFVQPIIIESRVSDMIPDSVIPQGGALSLVMSDVRQIAGGLDAVLANTELSEEALNSGEVDFTTIRARMAEVGVALAGDVPQEVYEAA